MMNLINLIGKTLVAFNLLLGVLFLSFALGIYLHQIDWGWKEPRKDLNVRIPSEIDKRTAALKLVAQERERVEGQVKELQQQLESTSQNWADYHLYYVDKLKEIRSAPNEIAVQKIKVDDKSGELVFDPTQPGKPVMGQKVVYVDPQRNITEVKKSFLAYQTELLQVLEQIRQAKLKIISEVKKFETITEQINGKFDQNLQNKLKPGVLDLIEQEKELQKQVTKEIDHIKPLWLNYLLNRQSLAERNLRLQQRVNELRAELKKQNP